MITVTSKDARSSIQIPGAWLILLVKDMEPKPAKDGSQNWIYTFDIEGDEKGSKEYEGCRVFPLYLNEKGIFGNSLNFLTATGFPEEEMQKLKKREKTEVKFDERAPVGKRMRAFVKWDTEFKANMATDFLPIGKQVA